MPDLNSSLSSMSFAVRKNLGIFRNTTWRLDHAALWESTKNIETAQARVKPASIEVFSPLYSTVLKLYQDNCAQFCHFIYYLWEG